jgi:hypothetical protein
VSTSFKPSALWASLSTREAFVTLEGETSYMARHSPRAPKHVVSLEKFMKVHFASKRKEANWWIGESS